jgi:hypothetical protein
MNRIVTATSNLELLVVDANDESKIKHQFKAKNALCPAFITSMVARGGYVVVRYVGMSTQGTALYSTLPLTAPTWAGSWFQTLQATTFATRDHNTSSQSDTNGSISLSYSSTDNPPWVKSTTKFLPPYGNGSEVKSLVWYGTNYGGQEYHSTFAVYVLDPVQYFTKTANDIVYIYWTVNLGCSGRTANAF